MSHRQFIFKVVNKLVDIFELSTIAIELGGNYFCDDIGSSFIDSIPIDTPTVEMSVPLRPVKDRGVKVWLWVAKAIKEMSLHHKIPEILKLFLILYFVINQ